MKNSIELFLRFPGFKTKAVTFSYDDGTVHDRKMIEILNRFGIKATFNLNAGLLGNDESHVKPDEIISLYAGHEVASHSLLHHHLENLHSGSMVYQVIADRERLESILEKPVQGFAFPFGFTGSQDVIGAIKSCGMRYARTIASTYNLDLPNNPLSWNPTCHHSDKMLNDLIDKLLSNEDTKYPWQIRPKLLYIWGHSCEFSDKWYELENICMKLSRHDDIWYATNLEIINYIYSYKEIRCSVNGRYIYNPTDTTIYLFADNRNIVLEPGKTMVI